MNWDNLLKANKEAKAVRYEPLPKFPAVRRDLALIFDKNVNFEQVKNVAFTAENKLLLIERRSPEVPGDRRSMS